MRRFKESNARSENTADVGMSSSHFRSAPSMACRDEHAGHGHSHGGHDHSDEEIDDPDGLSLLPVIDTTKASTL